MPSIYKRVSKVLQYNKFSKQNIRIFLSNKNIMVVFIFFANICCKLRNYSKSSCCKKNLVTWKILHGNSDLAISCYFQPIWSGDLILLFSASFNSSDNPTTKIVNEYCHSMQFSMAYWILWWLAWRNSGQLNHKFKTKLASMRIVSLSLYSVPLTQNISPSPSSLKKPHFVQTSSKVSRGKNWNKSYSDNIILTIY